MYIQDNKTKKEYAFELKDRLIRDDEYDGWKEIPAKVEESDESEDGIVGDKTLPGELRLI